jgi:hypothetical protein
MPLLASLELPPDLASFSRMVMDTATPLLRASSRADIAAMRPASPLPMTATLQRPSAVAAVCWARGAGRGRWCLFSRPTASIIAAAAASRVSPGPETRSHAKHLAKMFGSALSVPPRGDLEGQVVARVCARGSTRCATPSSHQEPPPPPRTTRLLPPVRS